MKSITLENYLGDDYCKVRIPKLRRLLEGYQELESRAEGGDVTALCVKIDLQNALERVTTEEEYICIKEYFMVGSTYKEAGRKIGYTENTAQARVDSGLIKVLKYLQTGELPEL